MKNILICAILVFQILSCSDKTVDPVEHDPKLSFAEEEISFSNGTTKEVRLELNDFTTEIFAISLQFRYDPRIISIDETTGFSAGDFFGQDEISLVKVNEGTVHLSISLTQGTAPVDGSGALGTFIFNGIATGNCFLVFDEDELFFYDESGNAVEIEYLELVSTLIKVD